jgi:septation ring formation regulator EzrA
MKQVHNQKEIEEIKSCIEKIQSFIEDKNLFYPCLRDCLGGLESDLENGELKKR